LFHTPPLAENSIVEVFISNLVGVPDLPMEKVPPLEDSEPTPPTVVVPVTLRVVPTDADPETARDPEFRIPDIEPVAALIDVPAVTAPTAETEAPDDTLPVAVTPPVIETGLSIVSPELMGRSLADTPAAVMVTPYVGSSDTEVPTVTGELNAVLPSLFRDTPPDAAPECLSTTCVD